MKRNNKWKEIAINNFNKYCCKESMDIGCGDIEECKKCRMRSLKLTEKEYKEIFLSEKE